MLPRRSWCRPALWMSKPLPTRQIRAPTPVAARLGFNERLIPDAPLNAPRHMVRAPHMSVFAQAAKIIGTLTGLAGLGQQGAGLGLGLSGITGGDLSAEYIAGSATSAGGDLGGIAAQLGKGPLVNRFDAYIKGDPIRNMKFTERMSGNRLASVENAKKGVKDIGKGVSIILWTITIVELLELTTGFAPQTRAVT